MEIGGWRKGNHAGIGSSGNKGINTGRITIEDGEEKGGVEGVVKKKIRVRQKWGRK